MTTPEGKIKSYLKRSCELNGWECLALVNPNMLGWPDRTLMTRSESGLGYIALAETKATTTRHKANHLERQKACRKWLRGLGFPVYKVSSETEVDQMIDDLVRQYWWPVYRGCK